MAKRKTFTLPMSTQQYVDKANLLDDALSWFDSHDVETKLGHLPQWVDMARAKPKRRRPARRKRG